MIEYFRQLIKRLHRAIVGPYIQELDGPAEIEQFFKEIVIERGRKSRASS